MSSPVSSIDDISPSFFAQYDALEEKARDVPRVRASLAEAQTALSVVQGEAAQATKQVQDNAAFCKEQTSRIKLVSKHWFYGTTALQPQLWLRGGCTGKVARARAKLEKALTEAPSLLCLQEELQNQQLPTMRYVVAERTAELDACVIAQAQRTAMKETVIEQNPSPHMCELREESIRTKNQLSSIEKVLSQLNKAKTCRTTAVQKLNEAQREVENAQRLVRKSGSRTRTTVTVRPCATPGCTFATSSWHATHCCNVCPQKSHRRHGRQCEKIPFAAAARAHDHGHSSPDHIRKILKIMAKAQSLVDQAVDQMRQGSTILSIVSNPTSDGLVAPSVTVITSSHLATLSPCGSESVKAQQRILLQALGTVRQYLSQASDLDSHLLRLDAKVRAEHDVWQRRLHQTNTELERERTRIFDAVRNQFVLPSGSYLAGSSVILPSAPSAPPGL
jgi:hypothetical protein